MKKSKKTTMNPKHLALTAVLFLAAVAARAQEAPAWHSFSWALGGGTELNQGAKEGWAQSYAVVLDRVLFDRRFALGVRGSLNNDYRTVSGFDGSLTLRLYPYPFGPGGAFAQLGFGAGSWQEDERQRLTWILDWSAGFRYFFLGGFYAEAYIRSGFPFQWALGILGGHSFTF